MAVHTLTTATPVKGDIAKIVAQQELGAVVAQASFARGVCRIIVPILVAWQKCVTFATRRIMVHAKNAIKVGASHVGRMIP